MQALDWRQPRLPSYICVNTFLANRRTIPFNNFSLAFLQYGHCVVNAKGRLQIVLKSLPELQRHRSFAPITLTADGQLTKQLQSLSGAEVIY